MPPGDNNTAVVLSLAPCDVNILIVADGDLRFNTGNPPSNGSLSLLIAALQERAGPLVRFNIKTAYRPNPNVDVTQDNRGADFPNFNFKNQENELSKFDQIWLFGSAAFSLDFTTPPSMTDDEIKALFDRMELKLGVFATGDHEDLGAAMNSRIPRVRSMRKWRIDVDPELSAASARNANRHDTLRKGADGTYKDENEKDEIPKTIAVVEFVEQNSSVKYAHPLLSGELGNIQFLPDHMHEGECCAPPVFVPTLSPFSNFEELEYPTINGIKVEPQIVAESAPTEAHKTLSGGEQLPEVLTTKFGAVAVYDGHIIEKGRVVVDSTFHHFINSNLGGLSNGNRTVAGHGLFAFEDTKNYFRNIGIWLTPGEKQRIIFRCALWEARWRSSLYFKLKNIPDTFVPNEHSVFISDLGISARAVLDRLVSVSTILEWTLNMISEFKINDLHINLSVPWASSQKPLSGMLTNLKLENLVNTILGGIVYSLARKFPGEEQVGAESQEQLIAAIEGAIKDGVIVGVQSVRVHLVAFAEHLIAMSQGFGGAFNLAD